MTVDDHATAGPESDGRTVAIADPTAGWLYRRPDTPQGADGIAHSLGVSIRPEAARSAMSRRKNRPGASSASTAV